MKTYDFWADVHQEKNTRKKRACISGLSSKCLKLIMTTPEKRICKMCAKIIDWHENPGLRKAENVSKV